MTALRTALRGPKKHVDCDCDCDGNGTVDDSDNGNGNGNGSGSGSGSGNGSGSGSGNNVNARIPTHARTWVLSAGFVLAFVCACVSGLSSCQCSHAGPEPSRENARENARDDSRTETDVAKSAEVLGNAETVGRAEDAEAAEAAGSARNARNASGADETAEVRGSDCNLAQLEREEMRIPSNEPGFEVFVMRVRAKREAGAKGAKGAVVMTHGAGSPSSAIWDLRYKDYSLMRNLACAGFDAYALDVRGFGGSTMLPGLRAPPAGRPPLVRAAETMPDVAAVVAFAQRASDVEQVDLFAWSWGCDVAAMFASKHPKDIRRIVLFAPVYDRRWPSRHISEGAWRSMPRSELFAFFDPVREEREVLEEIAVGMFRFNGVNNEKPDAPLHLPNGPYRDIYGADAPVWSARAIEAPTLILRGDQDKASTAESVRHLLRDLSHARAKQAMVLKGMGHFAFRERGHATLTRAVIDFFSAPEQALRTAR